MVKPKTVDWRFIYDEIAHKKVRINDPFPDPDCRLKDMPKRFKLTDSCLQWSFTGWGVPFREFDEEQTVREVCEHIAEHARLVELECNEGDAPEEIEREIFKALRYKLREEGVTAELEPETLIEGLDARKFYAAVGQVSVALPFGFQNPDGPRVYRYHPDWKKTAWNLLNNLYISVWYPFWLLWHYARDFSRSLRAGQRKRAAIILAVPIAIVAWLFHDLTHLQFKLSFFSIWIWMLSGYVIFSSCPTPRLPADLKGVRFSRLQTLRDFSYLLRLQNYQQKRTEAIAPVSRGES